MPKTLNDMQLVLLSAAVQREDESLLPVPASIAAKPPQLRKALQALLDRQLIAEMPVGVTREGWREEEGQRFGLIITEAGRHSIGVGSDVDVPEQGTGHDAVPSEAEAPAQSSGAGRGAKQALLIEILARADGVSIDEITAATAWLPHSARAMLTGLRKRGFAITSEKADGVRRYRAAAPEAKQ